MIQGRALRADRSRIASMTTSTPLANLLHNHVLIEWQAPQRPMSNREVLTFSHHVLFDYAVARLLLRGDPRQIVERIKEEPDLVLMIQPSFILHFRHLWTEDEDHQSFWALVLHMVTQPYVPHVAKLLGPSIAAESATVLRDLTPLLDALNDADETIHVQAEAVFRSIIGALIAGRGIMVGVEAGPWCAVLERVTQTLEFTIIYAIRALLSTICDQPGRLTLEQRNDAGTAARRLLEFAWAQTPRDSQLVIPAMQCVCRTFESDPEVSGSLLRRCFEPSQLTEHGFEEIPLLAREATRLMPIDPEFVTMVYMVAFAYVERSTEQTSIGTSRILALTSTRSQDYNLARYVLGEAFSKFLTTAPLQARVWMCRVTEKNAVLLV